VAERLTLEVATPARLVVTTAAADEVVIPGADGYFGVLPGHAPLLALLGMGEVMYRTGREARYLAVMGGVVEVAADRVTILAQTAEPPDEIDVPRARAARDRASGRLEGRGGEGIDYPRASAALARAQARLQAAGRRSGA
jgi:F-type H+-transporting ATPase subunit epsilon